MIPFGTTISPRNAPALEVALAPIDDVAAVTLANAFAHMSPWKHYPFTPDTLTRYFTTEEPGAPRYGLRLTDGTNTVVGALGLRENWLRGPYIQFLGVTEAYQNRGIGAALLDEVEKRARQDGAENVWVMASKFNDRAQNFYCRFGFCPVANIDALVTEHQTEVLLRKRLG